MSYLSFNIDETEEIKAIFESLCLETCGTKPQDCPEDCISRSIVKKCQIKIQGRG